MTRYVALLRGINVGGNNIIKMLELKACFEDAGFNNVLTYIQSGNVIFDSDEKKNELEDIVEKLLSKTFNYKSTVMIRSLTEIKKVIADAPKNWNTRTDIRCYIAFVKKPSTPQDVINQTPVKEGIDSIKKGESVVYMTSLIKFLTKSYLNKIASLTFYKDITIRNFNTTKKILILMEKE